MNNFRFLNIDWLMPVLFTGIILLIIFIWKEWRVSGNRRFLIKSFLAFLAIASLALVTLKPFRLVEAEENKVHWTPIDGQCGGQRNQAEQETWRTQDTPRSTGI